MKKTIAVILMMFCALSAKAQNQSVQEQAFARQSIQAQAAMTNHRWCGCPTPDSTQLAMAHTPLLNQTYNLAIVFVDFNEGRINGQSNGAYADSITIAQWRDLGEFERVEAVGGFGYRRKRNGELGDLWVQQVNKYGWMDYWKMYLSNDDSYRDADGTGGKHPDWTSHKLKAFGSVRQYWSEASYGNIFNQRIS